MSLTNTNEAATNEAATRLLHLVGGIPVAMLTTVDPAGALHARPITVKRLDEDGAVWFLVDADAEWVADHISSVNLAFNDGATWVSATGSAQLVLDPDVIHGLGDPVGDAWFEEGSTPAALRVDLKRADYWDGPGQLAMLLYLGKGTPTGPRPAAAVGGRSVVNP